MMQRRSFIRFEVRRFGARLRRCSEAGGFAANSRWLRARRATTGTAASMSPHPGRGAGRLRHDRVPVVVTTGYWPARLRRCVVIGLIATAAFAGDRRRATAPLPDASCPFTTSTCTEGGAAFAPLGPAEVTAIVNAAASALDVNTATIAVVDRTGRPLALFRQPSAIAANDDQAIGVARTAAFFSQHMAPLSSRTV